MQKLGRNYNLTVEAANGQTTVISLPFTIEFDITRNTLSSANVCQIRIYNLSEKTRNSIRRNASNYGLPFQSIKLEAGYGDNLTVIFTGNISSAWSVREGVNFITQIECYDGGFAFANATVNPALQFQSGQTKQTAIGTLASSLSTVTIGGVPYDSGLTVGCIGSFPIVSSRANVYSGNTCDVLKDLTGGSFFIDNGKVNALGTYEYAFSPMGTQVIEASSGLLNTPVLEQTIVKFDMIFEPTLQPGIQVYIQSSTESNFSGFCKITAIKHRGMISQTVCGSAITTGEFFYSKLLTEVLPYGI